MLAMVLSSWSKKILQSSLLGWMMHHHFLKQHPAKMASNCYLKKLRKKKKKNKLQNMQKLRKHTEVVAKIWLG